MDPVERKGTLCLFPVHCGKGQKGPFLKVEGRDTLSE